MQIKQVDAREHLKRVGFPSVVAWDCERIAKKLIEVDEWINSLPEAPTGADLAFLYSVSFALQKGETIEILPSTFLTEEPAEEMVTVPTIEVPAITVSLVEPSAEVVDLGAAVIGAPGEIVNQVVKKKRAKRVAALCVPPTEPKVKKKRGRPAKTKTAPVKAKKLKIAHGTAHGTAKQTKRPKPNGMTVLDACFRLLSETGEHIGSAELVKRLADKGYWKGSGKSPATTIRGAIYRDMAKKKSRFRIKDGKFVAKS